MKEDVFKELVDMPVSVLPLDTQLNVWYGGTQHIALFARDVMVPILSGQFGLSDKEKAIVELYYRMWLLLESVVALNNIRHFQSISSAVRSLFELLIDLEMLVHDANGDLTKKFNEHTERERYRAARNIVEFERKNPGSLKDIRVEQEFCEEPERKRKFEGKKLKAGDHWSENNDLRNRSRSVGREALYVASYAKLSWQVHGGVVGTTGLPKEYFSHLFGYAHGLAQKIFIDATKACAKFMRISEIEYFSRWVDEVSLKTGELITEEQIKILESRRQKS